MMKMNSQAKFGTNSMLTKEIKAELLNIASKQQIVAKEYVQTTSINMANKIMSTTVRRRNQTVTPAPQADNMNTTPNNTTPNNANDGGSGY